MTVASINTSSSVFRVYVWEKSQCVSIQSHHHHLSVQMKREKNSIQQQQRKHIYKIQPLDRNLVAEVWFWIKSQSVTAQSKKRVFWVYSFYDSFRSFCIFIFLVFFVYLVVSFFFAGQTLIFCCWFFFLVHDALFICVVKRLKRCFNSQQFLRSFWKQQKNKLWEIIIIIMIIASAHPKNWVKNNERCMETELMRERNDCFCFVFSQKQKKIYSNHKKHTYDTNNET